MMIVAVIIIVAVLLIALALTLASYGRVRQMRQEQVEGHSTRRTS
jgi:hypothetical protein